MRLSIKKLSIVVIITLLSVKGVSQAIKTVTVTNPSPIERTDELIVLTKSILQKKLGVFSSKKYVTLQKEGRPVVVQYDDRNGDGTWDEACFLYTFQPLEKAIFNLSLNDAPATVKAMVRAHVRQMHKLPDESFGPSVLQDTMPYNNQPTDFSKQKLPPYLTEGPAWENDKVGFRKYFDVRNANDIWGKVTGKMMMDEVGVHPEVIYHDFNPTWGMDILKVGKSLGAGGLALRVKINGKDSLVRFGTDVGQTTYEQVADGPIRAVFRIKYRGWKIDNLKPIDATEEISIWGGQYFYENKVTLSGAPVGAKLVTGTIDFYTDHYDTLSLGKVKGLYTYGIQSENKDKLGLGIVTNSINFASFYHTPSAGNGILNAYVVYMKIVNANPITYRYYTGWERTNDKFASEDGFGAFIKEEAEKLNGNLIIK